MAKHTNIMDAVKDSYAQHTAKGKDAGTAVLHSRNVPLGEGQVVFDGKPLQPDAVRRAFRGNPQVKEFTANVIGVRR